MSRYILGDSVQVMSTFPAGCIDFILTDPPYLVGFTDRDGRSIANDKNGDWVLPASREMFRVLKPNSLMVSFYGWNRVDSFVNAWKQADFRIVGHLVFTKTYASKSTFVGYSHENAYILAKGRPPVPANPLSDVLPCPSGKRRTSPDSSSLSASSGLSVDSSCPRHWQRPPEPATVFRP
nr:methylase [Yersinia frederiksenii]ULG20009.1 methylase [Yersinia frederiksenii]